MPGDRIPKKMKITGFCMVLPSIYVQKSGVFFFNFCWLPVFLKISRISKTT